jgi:hypothetical protein
MPACLHHSDIACITAASAAWRKSKTECLCHASLLATAGQELHSMIAQRYGAPTASIRDSLFDLMYNDTAAQQLLGTTRTTLLADPVHPSAAGYRVYGDIVAYSVRQTLAAVISAGAASPADLLQASLSSLPPPISPVAARQDSQPWCSEGLGFAQIASCASSPVRTATAHAAGDWRCCPVH